MYRETFLILSGDTVMAAVDLAAVRVGNGPALGACLVDDLVVVCDCLFGRVADLGVDPRGPRVDCIWDVSLDLLGFVGYVR